MSTLFGGVTPSRQRRKRSDDAATRVLLIPVRASRANGSRTSGADPSKIEKVGSSAPTFESKKNSFIQKYVQSFIAARARGLSRKLFVREYGHCRTDLASVLRENPRVEYYGEERAQHRVELVLLNGKNHVPQSRVPLPMDLVIAVDAAREIAGGKLREWIAGIVNSLAPGGAFLLFANKLITRTVYMPESGYLHAFHRALPKNCSLTVTTTKDVHHDVYSFERNKKRVLLYQPLGRRAGVADVPTLDARGEAMLAHWIERTSQRLASGAIGDEERIVKLQEELAEERQERHRIEAINRLADELEAISAEATNTPAQTSTQQEDTIEYNATQDCQYAQQWTGWDRVAHVANSKWVGIRGATAYLPGHKFIIPTLRPIQQQELSALIDQFHVKRIETAIIQGYSENMHLALQALHKAFGAHMRIIAVWHGNTSQFHGEEEFTLFSNLVRFKKRGIVDRLYCVKPGFSHALPVFEQEVPLNAPPCFEITPRLELDAREIQALVPLAMIWRKNVHTNVFAACSDPRIRKILVVGHLQASIVAEAAGRIELIPWVDRQQLFAHIRRSNLLLCATLSECQPMILLESIAHGVPCITQQLGIPEFDEHPYMRLFGVNLTDNLAEVGRSVSRLLDYGKNSSLHDISLDYAKHVAEAARRSWERLL